MEITTGLFLIIFRVGIQPGCLKFSPLIVTQSITSLPLSYEKWSLASYCLQRVLIIPPWQLASGAALVIQNSQVSQQMVKRDKLLNKWLKCSNTYVTPVEQNILHNLSLFSSPGEVPLAVFYCSLFL